MCNNEMGGGTVTGRDNRLEGKWEGGGGRDKPDSAENETKINEKFQEREFQLTAGAMSARA